MMGNNLNTELMQKFARLSLAKKKMKEKLSEIEKQLETMQPIIINNMTDAMIEKFSLKGGVTIFTKTQIWPKIKTDRDKVAAALKEAGLGELVAENFNSNRLASYLRELYRDEKQLPPALAEHLEMNAVIKVQVRKY